MTFRFKHADVKMQAAEEDFEAGGRKFRAGAFIIAERQSRRARADAERRSASPAFGGRGGADGADARPRRAAHRLRPQLGEHAERRLGARGARHLRRALHLLRRHQAARGQPAPEVRRHRLSARRRQRRSRRSTAFRRPADAPLPYKKTAETPNLGAHRSGRRHPRRHGLGRADGARRSSCAKAGRSSPKGRRRRSSPSTTSRSGVTVESPDGLFVRGSVMRGVFADRRSPIAYGYDAQVPVYFSQDPVLNVGGGGRLRRRRWRPRAPCRASA